ncbi:hypothetical protein EDB80DRAFT_565867 [Ilyonectria destructans]|nr:hypothetical protein EDB80DRAFT_565867 [Ilyonectria destructans]
MPNHRIRPRGRQRQCAYCHRVFTKEEHLRRHQRSHTGERPFKCEKCGRSYARRCHSDVLFRHLQAHSSDRVDGTQSTTTYEGAAIARQCNSSPGGQVISVPDPEQQSAASPTDGAHTSHQRSLPLQSLLLDDPSPMSQAEATGETQHVESYQQDIPADKLPFDIFETFEPQLNVDMLSVSQLEEKCGQGQLLDEGFELFGHNLQQTSSPDDLGASSNMLGYFEILDSVKPTLPLPMPVADIESTSSAPMAPSEAQAQLMGRLWSRQKPKLASRLIRRLWKQVIHHNADNIFTAPKSPGYNDNHAVHNNHQTSRCRVNEACRSRLVRYCKELDWSFRQNESPDDHDSSFPAMEILDSSLDFFFHFFHPILPFMHRSTFDARNTPSSLLLAMCLVGLSYLDRAGTRAFVIRYLKSCLNDMTSQTLRQCALHELLATLASTLIVVYLALGFRVRTSQIIVRHFCLAKNLLTLCRMRLMSTRHTRSGLFAASKGDDPTLQLRGGPSDPEGFWNAWARVESIKRHVLFTIVTLLELMRCSLIFCFVWLDMAYARLMNTAGVIEIDKVELHLPCEDALFDGSTSASFLHALQLGARVTMPRINIRNFHATSAPSLNDTSAQLLLRALYLKLIAARTRLSDEDSGFSESHSASPVEALSIDTSIKDIIANVLLLPTTHAIVLGSKNRNNALGWNYLCMTLTADVDLLEVASGRDGLEAASAALVRVAKWSRTASARRAVLHAAQVFDILYSSRIRESHLTRPDLVLFVSALVISQYVLVARPKEVCLDAPPFELLQSIDWTVVRNEGLTVASEISSSRTTINGEQPVTFSAVRYFIQYGGQISFAGEVLTHGDVTARKIVRKFAHLMGGLGIRSGSSYSQLLKIMCDSMIQDSLKD